jgi:hypothetical protein
MKRFALVASASLALLIGACDDDPPKKVDAGSDARLDTGAEAGSEGGVPGQCVGTFAQTNRTVLGAATKADGMCKSATDLDLICSQDIGGTIRRDYAVACLGTLMGGNAAVVACINDLAKRDFKTLSDGCLGCYSASVACTLQNCLMECATAATSKACTDCQTAKGCLPAFFACSGLPGGPTPTTDGGADTAPDTAPTTDAGVDAPVDAPPADAASDTATDTGSDV